MYTQTIMYPDTQVKVEDFYGRSVIVFKSGNWPNESTVEINLTHEALECLFDAINQYYNTKHAELVQEQGAAS